MTGGSGELPHNYRDALTSDQGDFLKLTHRFPIRTN